MEVDEFNNLQVLDKLNKENKKVYLMGDFNIDLMKIEADHSTSDFLTQ